MRFTTAFDKVIGEVRLLQSIDHVGCVKLIEVLHVEGKFGTLYLGTHVRLCLCRLAYRQPSLQPKPIAWRHCWPIYPICWIKNFTCTVRSIEELFGVSLLILKCSSSWISQFHSKRYISPADSKLPWGLPLTILTSKRNSLVLLLHLILLSADPHYHRTPYRMFHSLMSCSKCVFAICFLV